MYVMRTVREGVGAGGARHIHVRFIYSLEALLIYSYGFTIDPELVRSGVQLQGRWGRGAAPTPTPTPIVEGPTVQCTVPWYHQASQCTSVVILY